MSWNDLFVNMDNTNFFNFSFLPKYGSAFVRGFEYTPVSYTHLTLPTNQ